MIHRRFFDASRRGTFSSLRNSLASSTLVLLPGMHGTADLAGPFIAALPAGQRHRVVTYPTDQPMSYDALLKLIEDDLGDATDLILVGESFSGPLALRFAAAHPERVRAVVLSASFVRPPLPSWLRWFAFRWVFRVPLPSFLIRQVVAGTDASDEFVAEVRLAIQRPKPLVLALRAREALTVDCIHALQQCRAPILYLAGNRDRLVWPFNRRTILDVNPEVIVRMIDSPHVILQSQPVVAVQEIREFMEAMNV